MSRFGILKTWPRLDRLAKPYEMCYMYWVFFPRSFVIARCVLCNNQMGNTVSAAEAVAAGITKPVPTGATAHHPHPHNYKDAVPPPECPMHQKVPATPAAEECPVKHRLPDDINPYNMVSCHFARHLSGAQVKVAIPRGITKQSAVINCFATDAASKSKSGARSTVPLANSSSNIDHTKSDRRW